jgi:hypothetical protein
MALCGDRDCRHHGGDGKARGANPLVREYAKSGVSPSALPAFVRRQLLVAHAKTDQ